MKTKLGNVNTPLATASLVCGVAAVVNIFICMFPFAICLGALAVIFAMLSRTRENFFEHAKIGFICGIVALAINLLLILVICGLMIFSITFRNSIENGISEFAHEFSKEFEDSYNYNYYNDYDPDDFYEDEEFMPYDSWRNYFGNGYPSVNHGQEKT